MSNINRRRFERVEVNKTVVLKNGTKGRVRDLSAGGVSIVLDGPPKGRPGDEIEVDIEHFGRFSGDVIRIMDEGLAMDFDLDEEGESRMIAELSGYRSGSDHD
ncbi:MAG: hypothetical protein A2516_11725 [Alphaproteobacteria bacterium RIFOXYD12_FULL_60_8]|nr:MAG: hypothetical protein A2516_11725 [Alphaproteobacteria bacterium RIFOXYD12_FULL_60_8]